MHVNVHCAVGIILSLIFIDYLTLFQLYLIIGVIVLIDFDFIFSNFAKDHNHRRLFTHSFIPYLILLPLGLIFIEFLWVGIAGLFHLLFDMLDWGIYPLTPKFKDEIFAGFLHVPKTEEKLKRCYFIKRYYARKALLNERPKTAFELAIEQLEALMKRGYLDDGAFDPFYSELTTILRDYIESRMDIRAPEMTTEEFLLSLKTSAKILDKYKEALKGFLEYADMVKFAKHQPSVEDAQKGYTLARNFVVETTDQSDAVS